MDNVGYIYQNQQYQNIVFYFSHRTSLKLTFRLNLDAGFIFFVFSKYIAEERFSNNFLCNHTILWAILESQIGFDSQFQLRDQLKKLHFPL